MYRLLMFVLLNAQKAKRYDLLIGITNRLASAGKVAGFRYYCADRHSVGFQQYLSIRGVCAIDLQFFKRPMPKVLEP